MSDAEKGVFEKVSLIKIGQSVLGNRWQDGCPFQFVGNCSSKAVIDLDKIKHYSEMIRSAMKITAKSDFRKLINSKDWFLASGFLDERHKKRYPIMSKQDEVRAEMKALRVYTKGAIAVSILFLVITVPFALLAGTDSLFLDIFICLLPAEIACGISFLDERFEKYSADEYEMTRQIRGLKNWIEDFTAIKEKPPSASIVWGDFIKWSYLLGVSQKAIKIAGEYCNVTIIKPPEQLENSFAILLSAKILVRRILIESLPFPLNLVGFLIN